MGARKRREPLRGRDDGQTGSGEVKEWRKRPNWDGCGGRRSVTTLRCVGNSFLASSLPCYFSWEQRGYAGRARSRVHDIPKWRLATKRLAYFGAYRRKGRDAGLGRKTGEYPQAR